MRYIEKSNGVLLTEIKDFNLEHIFECGQCFRWEQGSAGGYTGVIGRLVIGVCESEGGYYFDNCTLREFEDVVMPYFDLSRDYGAVKKQIAKDDIIRQALAFGYGIRILRQDVWEMIVSFILSQRCSIPKIRKVIAALCEAFGEPLVYQGKTYYTFPAPEALAGLSVEDLQCLRCGYRDRYLLDAARKVADKTIKPDMLFDLSYEEAKDQLKQIDGIGDKVAQCILLFGLQKYEAFPVDTWIRKVMQERYRIKDADIPAFALDYFQSLSGFAQQYLFFCARENGFCA